MSSSLLKLLEDTNPKGSLSPLWNLFATSPGQVNNTGARPPAPCAAVFNPEAFFWAFRNLPIKQATQHMACIGTIGSGKTTLIRLLLQSIAPRIRSGATARPEQLIIFDPKFEAIPILAGLGFHPDDPNVYIFNPHDQRSVSWDMAESAKTPLMARHLAALLVPEEERSSAPFFATSARDLLYAVILALNVAKPGRWTFRDLICAVDSKKRILKLTSRHHRAAVIAKRVFDDDRHAFGVLASLATKLVQFETVAALWHSNPKQRNLSIPHFLKNPGVLVLGGDSVLEDTLRPINALLLKAIEQEILREDETDRPRHWFVLDEFVKMGKVPCIDELLRLGRSKGVSVLLGVHGIEGLISTYGQHPAEQMLGLCTYKTFLRASSPSSAEWSQRYFAVQRKYETVYAESWSSKGEESGSYTYQLQDRPIFLSTLFLDMPLPEKGRSIFAISDVPCHGCTYVTRRPFDDLLRIRTPLGVAEPVIPRDSIEEQTLARWEEEEERDFCGELEEEIDQSSKNSKQSAPGKKTAAKKKGPKKKRAGKKGHGLPDRRERRKPPPEAS